MTTQQMDIKIEGLGTISEGSYGRIKVEGVGKIRGNVEFETMEIEGTCNADQNLKGGLLNIEGMFKVKGDIRVKQLHIEGMLRTEDRKIYANEIRVEGMLKNSGEVNADRVIIEGCASINDLFGDEITIDYGYMGVRGLFHFGHNKLFEKMNRANNIECSKLTAQNLTCHSISATDIVLSSHCVVDTIYCNGTLRYDSTCRIKHIEGDCVQQGK
ncbi:MAG: polymer-forming cytoskeletal protein [Longicatena sp.]